MNNELYDEKTVISPVTFLGLTYETFEHLMEAFANNFDDAILFFNKNSIIPAISNLPQEVIDLTLEFEGIIKNTKDKKAKDKLLFEYIYSAYPTYNKFCYKTIKAFTMVDFVYDLSNKL